MKEIDSLATNEENMDVVERNLTSFRFSVEELEAGFAALLNDLESEEDVADVANEWYINLNERTNDFLDKTVLWISTAKETIEHSLETRSQVGSLYSTSHRSKASSRHSNRSITSSRAREKAKAAELKARVAILEKRKELELRVEKLSLEEQLAVARLREGVFAEIERGVGDADSTGRQELSPKDCSVQASTSSGLFLPTSSSAYTSPAVTSNTMTKVSFTADLYDAPMIQTPPKPMQQSSLNPFSPEFHVGETKQDTEPLEQPKQEPFASEPRYMAYTHQSTKQFCEVPQQQNRLTELLAGEQQQSFLPSLTLTKFSGDPLECFTFIRSFESQVEAKVSANDVRLQYLEQYLHGEPKDLIKGYLHLDRHGGYLEAKKLLNEKYGDRYKISNAYLNRNKRVALHPTRARVGIRQILHLPKSVPERDGNSNLSVYSKSSSQFAKHGNQASIYASRPMAPRSK